MARMIILFVCVNPSPNACLSDPALVIAVEHYFQSWEFFLLKSQKSIPAYLFPENTKRHQHSMYILSRTHNHHNMPPHHPPPHMHTQPSSSYSQELRQRVQQLIHERRQIQKPVADEDDFLGSLIKVIAALVKCKVVTNPERRLKKRGRFRLRTSHKAP